MKKISLVLGVCLGAFTLAPAVTAQDFQASAGVGYTYAPQVDDYGSLSATGRLGYYFNENFGVEGEGMIGLGEKDLNGLTIGETNLIGSDSTMTLDSQVGAFLVGRIKGSAQSEYSYVLDMAALKLH